MPRPVYIVCAESAVEDKATNLISLFNVIEKCMLSVEAPDESGSLRYVHQPTYRAVAVWMKEVSDGQKTFEADYRIVWPDGKSSETPAHRFRFEEDKHLHRLILDLRVNRRDPPSGILRIQSRLREAGTTDWLVQEYPIVIEVHRREEAAAHDRSTDSESR